MDGQSDDGYVAEHGHEHEHEPDEHDGHARDGRADGGPCCGPLPYGAHADGYGAVASAVAAVRDAAVRLPSAQPEQPA